jgi:hypothetical protein
MPPQSREAIPLIVPTSLEEFKLMCQRLMTPMNENEKKITPILLYTVLLLDGAI